MVEAIGRRFEGERVRGGIMRPLKAQQNLNSNSKIVVYSEFLKMVRTELSVLEEGERRREAQAAREGRETLRETEQEMSFRERAARRARTRNDNNEDNFADPFWTDGRKVERRPRAKTKNKTNHAQPTPMKSAWRGPKGHAPSVLPSNNSSSSSSSSYPLPMYLRGVSSKIKGELDTLRRYRSKAEEARKGVAREVVAKRRYEREYNSEDKAIKKELNDGRIDMEVEGMLAREIAGMYSEVVDGIVGSGSGNGGSSKLGEYFGDVVEDSGSIAQNRKEEDEKLEKIVRVSVDEGKESYSTRSWVGEFDFSSDPTQGKEKGGREESRKISEEEVFKLESGEDVRVVDARNKQ